MAYVSPAWPDPGPVRVFASSAAAEEARRAHPGPAVAVVFAEGCSHCETLKPIFRALAALPLFAPLLFLAVEGKHAQAWVQRYGLTGLPSVLAFGRDATHQLSHGTEESLQADLLRFRRWEEAQPAGPGPWRRRAQTAVLDPVVRELLSRRFSRQQEIVAAHRRLGEFGWSEHLYQRAAYRHNVPQTPVSMTPARDVSDERQTQELLNNAWWSVVQQTTGQGRSRRRKNLTLVRWLHRRLVAGEATSWGSLFGRT